MWGNCVPMRLGFVFVFVYVRRRIKPTCRKEGCPRLVVSDDALMQWNRDSIVGTVAGV